MDKVERERMIDVLLENLLMEKECPHLIEFLSAIPKREIGAMSDPNLYYQHSRKLQL